MLGHSFIGLFIESLNRIFSSFLWIFMCFCESCQGFRFVLTFRRDKRKFPLHHFIIELQIYHLSLFIDINLLSLISSLVVTTPSFIYCTLFQFTAKKTQSLRNYSQYQTNIQNEVGLRLVWRCCFFVFLCLFFADREDHVLPVNWHEVIV